jgi:hypothetical protein
MSPDAAIRDLEESIRACVDHYEEDTGMTPPSPPHPSDATTAPSFPDGVLLHLAPGGLLEVAHGLNLPGHVGPVFYVRGNRLTEAQQEAAAAREEARLLSDHNLTLLDQRREVTARVRLLEDAVLRDDKPALIRHHVARLAEMVR